MGGFIAVAPLVGRRSKVFKNCAVCGEPFRDEDAIMAVMLSEYKEIESDVHYAITTPTTCLEIIHRGCYDFPNGEDGYHQVLGL